MGSRIELQTLLEGLLGTSNVYFQPPMSVNMSYPAIVYNRSDIRIDHANNKPYAFAKEYTITVIDPDPDSDIPDKIAELSTARFNRGFAVQGLNHSVFTIFF